MNSVPVLVSIFVEVDYLNLIFTGRNEVVANVMFLLVCVILLTEGGSASVHAGIPPTHPPPEADTPRKQTPSPRKQIPPLEADPWEADTPPPGIRSMSGRYASYWNAFL